VPHIPGPEDVIREPVIEARQLTRSFDDVWAVRGASFTVGRGEIFGFFGPNGAGKTTTMRMLCGLLRPTTGRATVVGHEVTEAPTRVRRSLAILPEEVSFYEGMTPKQYLRFFSKMAGAGGSKGRLERAVRVAEIEPFYTKPIKTLSHGQRQKVSLARVLLSDASVMFLDEPFQGIDIVHRKAMRQYLRNYVSKGGTVFFTSHNLIEAEHIVDRFAFIDRGYIVTIGTARELRDEYLLPSYALRVSDPERANDVISEALEVTESYVKDEDEVVVTLKDAGDVPRIAQVLGEAGIAIMEMKQRGTMEEVFLSMRMKREAGP
jgi:ABC-type multidrug transport system ATPase subunit